MIDAILQYFLASLLIGGAIWYRLRLGEDAAESRLWRWLVRPILVGDLALVWFLPVPGFGAAVAHLMIAGWLAGLFLQSLGQYLVSHGQKPGDQHRRGAQIADARQLARLTKKQAGGITIGGVPFPRDLENYHLAVVGATGSGKSVAITEMLDAITARGDRMIVADSGGLYLQRCAQDGDYLINPFDSRCADWSPLAEMAGPAAADALARSYIPDAEGSSRQWSAYAQTVLAEILRKVHRAGGKNRDLYRLACEATPEDLAEFLKGTAAAPLVDLKNATMGANIRSMVASALAPVRYLPADAGRDGLSIRKWVMEGTGNLYITYLDEQLDSLKGLIGTILDLASRSILSLPPSNDRRIWLVADELASLGRIATLETFLTKARKAGGCAIVGLQSVSQLRERYGRDGAQTIMSCLSSWAILRASDHESAKIMAETIGQAEVRRTTHSGGKNPSGESENWSEHVVNTNLVMPSELQNLPNLHGYLILSGDYPTAKIKLAIPPQRSGGEEPFVQDSTDAAPAAATPPADPAPVPQGEPETAQQTPAAAPQPEPQPAPAFKVDF